MTRPWFLHFYISRFILHDSTNTRKRILPRFFAIIIIIIIIIIKIIIIIIISFMHGIYTYIPETNYVPRQYSVAAIVVTINGVYIVSSSVESIVLLH